MKYTDPYNNTYNIVLEVSKYANNDNLAVIIIDADDGCEYAMLTVNIDILPAGFAAIDTNNVPNAEKFIKDYQIGAYAGFDMVSGYCKYPVYEMFLDRR